jgi:hypothetical protein
MHEHRAGEDELLDLNIQFAQSAEQPPRAAHGDLVVLLARRAEEIVVGGQVDDRGDVRPVVCADDAQALAHALVRGDFDGDVDAARRRRFGRFAAEADDVVKASGKPSHDGVANSSVGACHEDKTVSCFNSCSSCPSIKFQTIINTRIKRSFGCSRNWCPAPTS